ncbi:MAG: hypothetical protein JNK05_06535 [Myxococcales bacterium]|nr:hypothetical protein [Myxococcales bacterium]
MKHRTLRIAATLVCGVALFVAMFTSTKRSMDRDAELASTLKREGVRVEALVTARRQIAVHNRTANQNTQGYSCMLRLVENGMRNLRIDFEHEHRAECRFAPQQGSRVPIVVRPVDARQYMLAETLDERDEHGRVKHEGVQRFITAVFAGILGLSFGYYFLLHKRA